MRQKKLKHVSKELLSNNGVITEITPIDLFDYQEVVLEVGSGKGKFISELANDNPLTLFIAFEVNINVLYRILEKKQNLNLNNLILVLGDANNLLEYLKPNSINTIYLNFSDPWPKARHHKRRLTFNKFLKIYYELLKDEGLIYFRTDHEAFYLDSINYFNEVFNKVTCNSNLEPSKYMTEYEILKRQNGLIMQIIGGKTNENS